MDGCSPANHRLSLLLAAPVTWEAVTFPPSLSSCDAKGVVSRHEAKAIYCLGGEVVEIVRESGNRMMQIAHGDEVETRGERGYAFL